MASLCFDFFNALCSIPFNRAYLYILILVSQCVSNSSKQVDPIRSWIFVSVAIDIPSYWVFWAFFLPLFIDSFEDSKKKVCSWPFHGKHRFIFPFQIGQNFPLFRDIHSKYCHQQLELELRFNSISPDCQVDQSLFCHCFGVLFFRQAPSSPDYTYFDSGNKIVIFFRLFVEFAYPLLPDFRNPRSLAISDAS